MIFEFIPTQKRQLPIGAHEVDGKTYKPGDLIETEHDLEKAFPHKFRRTERPPAAINQTAVIDDDNSDGEDGVVESSLGENVTEDWPEAAVAGLLVLKKGSRFYVVDAEEPDESLTEKSLTKKQLEMYLAEVDTEELE